MLMQSRDDKLLDNSMEEDGLKVACQVESMFLTFIYTVQTLSYLHTTQLPIMN